MLLTCDSFKNLKSKKKRIYSPPVDFSVSERALSKGSVWETMALTTE